jgi:hypothetical protein
MKTDALLERFITLILLLGLPHKQATAGSLRHIQPTTADLLPLTRFLKTMLEQVRAHEVSQAHAGGLVFRIPPVIPEPLPLTRFLKIVLDRVRARELSQARESAEVELVFRVGQPE